jgi:hypothetical protein
MRHWRKIELPEITGTLLYKTCVVCQKQLNKVPSVFIKPKPVWTKVEFASPPYHYFWVVCSRFCKDVAPLRGIE